MFRATARAVSKALSNFPFGAVGVTATGFGLLIVVGLGEFFGVVFGVVFGGFFFPLRTLMALTGTTFGFVEIDFLGASLPPVLLLLAAFTTFGLFGAPFLPDAARFSASILS